MGEPVQLWFGEAKESGLLLLPRECSITLAQCDDSEICQTIAVVMEQILYGLAWSGLDLRALDGVTLSEDCRNEGAMLQHIPEGESIWDTTDRPGTMEMARTVVVRRDGEVRLHIVLKTGLALMAISPQEDQQAFAYACIAHEAAHVDHEGHLYRTFSDICGRPLECRGRSRRIFLRAMDVWSEYAACRSSASFRPEAVEEFEGLFCRTLEECLSVCRAGVAVPQTAPQASQADVDIEGLFGDILLHAGYFLGYLDGLGLTLDKHAPHARSVLRQHPRIEILMARLDDVLEELWVGEESWESIEVFAPIYDLIVAMMELHGFTLGCRGNEGHAAPCSDDG